MRRTTDAPSRFRTVHEALASAAESDSTLTFVNEREEDTVLPWAVVRARARRFAAALHREGVRPGDRVAIVLPTSPFFPDAFFGALLAGAIPVPLYPPVRLGRMAEYHRSTARMLGACGARLVVSDARIRLLLGPAVAHARPRLGLRLAPELLERHGNGAGLEVDADPSGLALIQFSSGSTVDPNPVALTHQNVMSQAAALHALMRPLPGTRELGVSWLPLYHDMGLVGALLSGIYYPGTLVLLPPEAFLVRPALWLRTISRFRATISPAPNFGFGLCLKRIRDEELQGVDLSSWTHALNGAEPVSAELMARFADRFAPYGFDPASLRPVYGLSEACLAVTFSPRRWPPRVERVDRAHLARTGEVREGTRTVVSVGAPVPGVAVEIRDERGAAIGERRVGRIWTRGPSVMRGYFGSDEATARALPNGWLDTGDLGFELDGELYVCGRAKDVVIVRGANHAPQEFEECLDRVEGVRTGCAVALGFVPESSQSEELLILAERAGAPDATLPERIRTAIAERTSIRPHTVEILEPGTLPRTSSGKLRRQEALRRYLAGELARPKRTTASGVALELVRGAAALAWFGLRR
ncbi:MAG TPA: fatty acyl-AMP ligase [Myxococcaceae bacterium]|nr:fatty acyl-AMP ligase [Myxococcaceae bacterium]